MLASVLRHLRERFPLADGRYQVDELTRAYFDEDGITVKRRRSTDRPFPEWGTRYPFRSLTEGVDLAVALGLLPVEFSSAHMAALPDASDGGGPDPAYVLSVAEHGRESGDPYLYLECGECGDMAVGIEAGDSLVDILAAARAHYALYHADVAGDRA